MRCVKLGARHPASCLGIFFPVFLTHSPLQQICYSNETDESAQTADTRASRFKYYSGKDDECLSLKLKSDSVHPVW